MLRRVARGNQVLADDVNQIIDHISNNEIKGDGKTIIIKKTPKGQTASTFANNYLYNGFFKVTKKNSTDVTVADGFAIIHNDFFEISEDDYTISATCYLVFECEYTLPVYDSNGIITTPLDIDTPQIVTSLTLPTYEANKFQTVIATITFSGGAITNIIQQQHGVIIGVLSDYYDDISEKQQKTQGELSEVDNANNDFQNEYYNEKGDFENSYEKILETGIIGTYTILGNNESGIDTVVIPPGLVKIIYITGAVRAGAIHDYYTEIKIDDIDTAWDNGGFATESEAIIANKNNTAETLTNDSSINIKYNDTIYNDNSGSIQVRLTHIPT